MSDIIVRFIGDASQLRAFYQQVGTETTSALQSMDARSQAVMNNFFKPAAGTNANALKTEIDSINGTYRTTGELVTEVTQKSTSGAMKQVETLQKLNQMQQSGITLTREQLALQTQLKTLGSSAAGFGSPVTTTMTTTSVPAKPVVAGNIKEETTALATERAELVALNAQLNTLMATYDKYTLKVSASGRAYAQDPTTGRIANLKKLETLMAEVEAKTEAYNAKAMALTPPVPQNMQQAYQTSPKAITMLTKQGLGAGLTDQKQIIDYLYNQQNVKVVDDLTRGIRTMSGEYTTATGAIKKYSLEIDKNGNVLTKMGGNLSGLRNTLSQITRDFQKVAEWTIATTVIFATMGTVIKGITTAKDLDAKLERFAITAKTSMQGSMQYFQQFSQVANATATPLQEMIGVMDDVALATRRDNQTTSDWRQSMADLSQAVGVYTNLTGTDAAAATEKLTAIMKQMGVQAYDVIGILNKITAVAGGQANAISDITTGLAVMAEAGKQASLTVNQQIATIQVLAQVTSKSPTEVATAFKNLVGAIQNPASIKMLKQYNIELHDQQGNLKNIIEIYTQINQKIQQGLIPAGEVAAVLRAISGGPRRSPDAAALLANIGQVSATAEKATNANNDALLANAKIMDTVQAKWTQFQNIIQEKIFGLMSGDFRDFASFVISGLTSIVSFGAQFGPLILNITKIFGIFLAAKGLVGIGVFLGNTLRSVGLTLSGYGQAVVGVIAKETQLNASTTRVALNSNAAKIAVSGLSLSVQQAGAQFTAMMGPAGKYATQLAAIRKYSGVGMGALIGGISAAATGGSPGQIAGTALAGAGMAAMAIPSGWSQVIGGVAMLGGTLLSMATSSDKATQALTKSNMETLDDIRAYNEASTSLQTVKSALEALDGKIQLYSESTDKSIETQTLLTQAQSDYADKLLVEADATQVLTEARMALNGVTADLITKTLLLEGQAATIGPNEASDLMRSVLGLKDATKPATFGQSITYQPGGVVAADSLGNGTNDQNGLNFLVGLGTSNKLIPPDITKMVANIQDYLDSSGKINVAISTKPEDILAIDQALDKVGASLGPEKLAAAKQSLIDMVSQVNPLLALGNELDFVGKSLLVLNSSGQMSDTSYSTGKGLQSYVTTIQQMIATDMRNNPTNTVVDMQQIDKVRTELAKLGPDNLKDKTDVQQSVILKDVFTNLSAIYLGYNRNVDATSAWNASVKKFGLDGTIALLAVKGVVGDITEEVQTTITELGKLDSSFAATTATNASAAQKKILAGGMSSPDQQYLQDQVAGQQTASTTLSQTVTDMEAWYRSLGSDLSGSGAATTDILKQSLSQIPGLGDAANLSMQDLMKNLVGMASDADLSGTQWEQFSAILATITPLLKEINASWAINTAGGGPGDEFVNTNTAVEKVNAAIKKYEDLLKQANSGNPFKGIIDFGAAAKKVWDDLIQKQQEYKDSLDAALAKTKTDFMSQIASQESSLQDRIQGGEFSKTADHAANPKQQQWLIDQIAGEKAAAEAIGPLIKGIDALDAKLKTMGSSFEAAGGTATTSFEKSLQNIPGMFDATGLSVDQLITKMMNLGVSANLSGAEWKKYADLMGKIPALLSTISQLTLAQANATVIAAQMQAASLGLFGDITGKISKAIAAGAQAEIKGLEADFAKQMQAILATGTGTYTPYTPPSSSSTKKDKPAKATLDTSTLDLPDAIANASNRSALVQEAIKRARALQAKIPGANKEASNDVVELLKGTQRILEVRGVKDDLLRKALEELAAIEQKKLEFDTKADMLQRIRIGSGSFAALANVPLNSTTGVSVGNPNNITVTLNINGQILTPAQFNDLANKIGSIIYRSAKTG